MPSHSAAARGTLLLALAVPLFLGIPLAVAQDDFAAQARALKAKGDVDGALALLQQGLATDPGNGPAHYVLGWLYVGKGEEVKAAAAFRRVLELSPDSDEGREAKAALERLTAGEPPAQAREPAPGSAMPPVEPGRVGPRPRMDGPLPIIAIDSERICPVVDGQPFLAIGCCGIPPEQMKTCAEAGFNLTVRWGTPAWCDPGYAQALSVGLDDAKRYQREYLSAAGEAGLYVVEHPLLFTNKDLHYGPAFAGNFDAFMRERLPQVIEGVRDHPALFGYYGPEEFVADPLPLVASYTHAVRANDPTHPIFLIAGWGSGYLTSEAWQNWGAELDITGDDWYPLPDAQLLTPACGRVRTHSAWARASGRAFWWVPLMTYLTEAKPYPLTPEAQRAQVYLALIGGANGIVWWMWPPRHVDTWEAIKGTIRELRALEPVLLERVVPTAVKWQPPELSHTIQLRAIQHDGRTWLLAANASRAAAEVKITLPCPDTEARVSFEDRTVEIGGGVLHDRFAGFDRHVYEIGAEWPADAPVGIEVGLAAAPTEYGPWPGRGFATSPANLIVDPGLEDERAWTFYNWGRPLAELSGSFEADRPLAGLRAATLSRKPGAASGARWTGKPITLKPNARYLFGGHMRTDIAWPCHVEVALHNEERPELRATTNLLADAASPWSRHAALFATGAAPPEVQPILGVHEGAGTASFDGLFLYEACPGIRNLVANGGFEGPEVAKGWPINWYETYSLEIPGHIGCEAPLWGVDGTTAYEGNHSLRMVHPGNARLGGRRWPLARQTLLPGTQLADGRSYVFSARMKADRPNLLVRVVTGGDGEDCHHDVRVGTAWEQYVLRATTGFASRQPFVAVGAQQEGTLWVDAVQFEPGTQPTDYQEWWY